MTLEQLEERVVELEKEVRAVMLGMATAGMMASEDAAGLRAIARALGAVAQELEASQQADAQPEADSSPPPIKFPSEPESPSQAMESSQSSTEAGQ